MHERALGTKTINQFAAWCGRKEPLGRATARTEAIRSAQRVRQTHTEIAQNDKQLSHLVAQSTAAGLTSETGIGAVTAATVLVAWGHTGRKPAAELAGFPCSSGLDLVDHKHGAEIVNSTAHSTLSRCIE